MLWGTYQPPEGFSRTRNHARSLGTSPCFMGSRFLMIFLMFLGSIPWKKKKKTDFSGCFVIFQEWLKNNLIQKKKSKIFQSNGGGEFTKSEFLDHLSHGGIIHLLSCPRARNKIVMQGISIDMQWNFAMSCYSKL